MPSYVNIGAYVGAGTMVDTWATVGSCAQIGANVHLSGGVGIGGVLEPASATPVIVEDGAFIGSRCILVEGVQVGEEAVLAANVTLTASTPIIDSRTPELKVTKGKIPPRAVVIPYGPIDPLAEPDPTGARRAFPVRAIDLLGQELIDHGFPVRGAALRRRAAALRRVFLGPLRLLGD